MVETSDSPVDFATQRALAVGLFNRVWDLLDAGDSRTPDETAEMVDAAHASRYLWRQIGGDQQAIVGEWQVSRAYAAAGNGAEAVRHAEIAEAILRGADDLPDWIAPSVHEGMARALLAAGDPAAALAMRSTAEGAAALIADPEDRALIESQIAELDL
ncbi:MAG: hypothetical protein WCI29_07450 [Actinomycetes bacterium]|jgi:hypothetical protein